MVVQAVVETVGKSRKARSPTYPIAGRMKPYGLYPLFVSPVLPGETVDSVWMKSRFLSKPIKNPLSGSLFEVWSYYVKFTDIDRNLGQMFVSDGVATTGYTADSDDPQYFTKTGQIKWVQMCVERIAESWFMHDNETMRTNADGVPMTKTLNRNWLQSAAYKPADIETSEVVGTNFDQNMAFEYMQLMTAGELTYEKYCQMFGARTPEKGQGDPELLWYEKTWGLPVNTVEPTTGSPSTCFLFSVDYGSQGKRKAWFCQEPGFIVTVCSWRPKVFPKYLDYSVLGNLWGFSDFFPVYNLPDPAASIKQTTTADPVFHADATTAGPFSIIYDHKDILYQGEAFVNSQTLPFDLPQYTSPTFASGGEPEDIRGEYVTATDIDSWFVSATAGDKYMVYEGMAGIRIMGHITDTTV